MGKVYLVGAGPGDPDLITVKGLKVIQKADVILYDRLINEELLSFAPEEVEQIYCGKLPEYHTLKQESINRFLCKFASQGKTVVRLKGGDPFIFGRGGEEAEALVKKGIPFEIVPGISAGAAAPAYAGIPLTHRDFSSSVAFVSGVSHKDDTEADWQRWARSVDTLCIYMGVKQLPYVCEQLIKHGRGRQTPVAIVHWGTTEQQQTVTGTLADIVEVSEGIKNPSMIIIGDVVKLRERLQWFEDLYLTESSTSSVI
ncbi:uroporphyrinogen-III C-methyltransferase [Tuberibacillus sp. Marseille-P3662]|uniref:uroporphyrinogen-III C-methyltransferase n=1 Tax=Tuberibacillus sp. Marseille-P3662 TaxID=1965358 RepID=UPI000A1CACB7|nr:uroporphyrinogen-III C-methyltransferase [Tuberibacillus sp. Marseille-P3662]